MHEWQKELPPQFVKYLKIALVRWLTPGIHKIISPQEYAIIKLTKCLVVDEVLLIFSNVIVATEHKVITSLCKTFKNVLSNSSREG